MKRVAIILIVPLFAACSGKAGTRGFGSSGASARVEISGFAFKPAQLSVGVGTKVTWKQEDSTVHTVTSGQAGDIDPATSRADNASPDGVFDSNDLAQGKSLTFTFNTPGAYSYFCKHHPEGMRGEIQVQGRNG